MYKLLHDLFSTQTSSPGIDQRIVSALVDGMQQYCQCSFSLDMVDQAIVQCFPENLEKINVLLLMQSSPNLRLSEMIMYMNNWIESDPVIMLNDTTLRIDGDCDIAIIQGPECGASTSPTTSPTTASTEASTEPMTISDGSGSGKGTDETPSNDNTRHVTTGASSQSQGPIIAGSVLIVVVVIVISLAVVVTLFILVRYKIVKCDNYNM